MVKNKECAVLVNVRDRPTELAMLLESLYFQTYKDFDIFILDDQSGSPLQHHFLNCIINRLRCSKTNVFIRRTEFPHGVSKARQAICNWALEKDYKYLARVDDDVVLETDFLERLVKVIDQGYDLASGVTPPMAQPTFIRDSDNLKTINQVVLDNEGNYVFCGDDCGMEYTDSVILPAHHFRSSALYKAEIHNKVNYTPTKLSKHGFREEQFFSYKCLMNGYKIGVDTGAIAWHQLTPSGGERFQDSRQLIDFNQKQLIAYTKEHKDKLNKIFGQPEITKLEQMKETNLR